MIDLHIILASILKCLLALLLLFVSLRLALALPPPLFLHFEIHPFPQHHRTSGITPLPLQHLAEEPIQTMPDESVLDQGSDQI